MLKGVKSGRNDLDESTIALQKSDPIALRQTLLKDDTRSKKSTNDQAITSKKHPTLLWCFLFTNIQSNLIQALLGFLDTKDLSLYIPFVRI